VKLVTFPLHLNGKFPAKFFGNALADIAKRSHVIRKDHQLNPAHINAPLYYGIKITLFKDLYKQPARLNGTFFTHIQHRIKRE